MGGADDRLLKRLKIPKAGEPLAVCKRCGRIMPKRRLDYGRPWGDIGKREYPFCNNRRECMRAKRKGKVGSRG